MTPDLYLAPERDKPEIDFRYSQDRLAIRGESYPENASAFYAPIMQSLKGYLDRADGREIAVDVDLLYFNSSSTKALLSLFAMLDQAAGIKNKVKVNWHFDPEDETIMEFGDDIAADCIAIHYQAVSKG